MSESNESNNTKATPIHIGPPDLIVSSLSASVTSGADLTTTLTVTDITLNQGGDRPRRSDGDALLALGRLRRSGSGMSCRVPQRAGVGAGGIDSGSTSIQVPPAPRREPTT